jgi:hypothetical protein
MVADGDYFVNDAIYNSLSVPEEKSAYIWAATGDFYGGRVSNDWSIPYSRILQCNIILDGLAKIEPVASDQGAYNNAKASALFYRSFDFFNLSQIYCKPYSSGSAAADLGLPLRLTSNINQDVKRSSLQQTYDQIIEDLKQAAPLLPLSPLYLTRPSQIALYALLSRVYLSQENYTAALEYANLCLSVKNDLLNFNELAASASAPITYFNKEVIFHAQLSSWSSFNVARRIISPELYSLYTDNNDLRKSIYFFTNAGNLTFKGNYTGSRSANFGGIATDEIYLIRAECQARAGNTAAAMQDLNMLLKTRWKTGTYADKTAASAEAALSLILTERRKELCFRNLRWSDLRRLNKDTRFQVTLTRMVNGQTYTLEPNLPQYVFPLDPIEITTGGLEQNPR